MRSKMPPTSQNPKTEKALHNCLVIWAWVGGLILFGAFIYVLQVLSLPVSILIWTVVFVLCLRGPVNWMSERGVKRGLATLLAYILMIAVIGAVGFLMFSPVFGLNDQFVNLVSSIPGYVSNIADWARNFYEKYSTWFDNDTVRSILASVQSSVSSWASDFAGGAATTVVDVSTAIANGATAIGFALVIAFWILMQLPSMTTEIKRIVPEKYAQDVHFLHVTTTTIMGGYIKATLIQCFLIGLGCGILFAIIGLPNAPALGVITGVLNIIPIVGPWLGGAVAAITAVFVSPFIAVIAIIGTVAIQQVIYTFVSPRIMASSVNIHPALTLIAMVIGSAIGGAMSGVLGGIVGMLISIPALAVLQACFIYYFEKSTNRRIVSPEGVLFKSRVSGSNARPFEDATNCEDVHSGVGVPGEATAPGVDDPTVSSANKRFDA
jgi:predicted PurR-regulated permease PerM